MAMTIFVCQKNNNPKVMENASLKCFNQPIVSSALHSLINFAIIFLMTFLHSLSHGVLFSVLKLNLKTAFSRDMVRLLYRKKLYG